MYPDHDPIAECVNLDMLFILMIHIY